MKIIGVIPARYGSTRFPGKPLADICGKPMIWWVYKRVSESKKISEVYVLTDDRRIAEVCNSEGLPFIMTNDSHPNHINRVQEAATKLNADCYVCINGDEPLIEAECIDAVIPDDMEQKEPVFYGAMRALSEATKVNDSGNIKLVVNENGRCLYMSRNAIPFPKGTLDFNYYKYIGIECFSKSTLDFFVNHPMGRLEHIEDIDHLRFLENQIPMYFKEVNSESLSVDTHKDLEYVISVMEEKGIVLS